MPKVDGTNFGFGQADRAKAQKRSEETGEPISSNKKPHEGDLVHSFGDRRIRSKTRGVGSATRGLDFYRDKD